MGAWPARSEWRNRPISRAHDRPVLFSQS